MQYLTKVWIINVMYIYPTTHLYAMAYLKHMVLERGMQHVLVVQTRHELHAGHMAQAAVVVHSHPSLRSAHPNQKNKQDSV